MTSSGISDGTSLESTPPDERRPAEFGQIRMAPRPAQVGQPVVPLWERAGHDFRAWRMGEEGALERLVRRLTPTLWHLARAQHLDHAAAEDVVQTTWLTMVRLADSIRDESAILSWLTVTARREAWRVSKASQQEDRLEPEMLSTAVPPAAGLDGEVIADAEARLLWRHVAGLPERCRRLLRTIAFDDRPNYRSISADLDMPRGSIGPTRKRCLDKLRELLAADAEWSE
jgi:RNA polymerase sigma factor (sigma-70 family)